MGIKWLRTLGKYYHEYKTIAKVLVRIWHTSKNQEFGFLNICENNSAFVFIFGKWISLGLS